jgi:hypothetical protein
VAFSFFPFSFLSTALNDLFVKYDMAGIQFDSQWGSCRTRAEIAQRESTGNPSAIRGFLSQAVRLRTVCFSCAQPLISGELAVGP